MNYRREIDGLRAIAILPVILFHAGFDFFSGGFVGVDVFFVISGYLITFLIVKDMEKNNFSLLDFYERRARRILPALFFLLLCCIPFAIILFAERDLQSFSKSLIAVAIFASNFFFFSETGYFDTEADFKPLLHTWSLSVEEQFYVLFPLILIFLYKIKISLNKKISIVFILFLVSLIIAHWGSFNKPDAAFFLIITRAWELLVGSLSAFYVLFFKNKKKSSSFFDFISLFGLFLIGYSVLFFSKSTPFPGLYALVPTLGAAFIIVFCDDKSFSGRLLGSKILVGIGLISYSAYLWHQPLFAFYRYFNIREVNSLIMLFLCFVAFAFAYLSWRFIEKPFRNKSKFSRAYVFSASIIGIVSFVAIGGFFAFSNVFETKDESIKEKMETNFGGDLNGVGSCEKWKKINGGYDDVCFYGDTSKKSTKIAVLGDSHSRVVAAVLDEIGKEKGFSFVHYGIGGCPPLIGADIFKGAWSLGVCKDLVNDQNEYIKKNNIDKVLLVARWSLYTSGEYYGKKMNKVFLFDDDTKEYGIEESRRVFEKSLDKTIANYISNNIKVIVLEQVPQQKNHPQFLYKRIFLSDMDSLDKKSLIKSYSISYEDHLKIQNFNRSVFLKLREKRNFQLINFDDEFCKENVCWMGDEDRSYYNDYNHLNNFGVSLLKYRLTKEILD